MKQIKNVKIGADPEVFIMDEQELVSAEGKFGGTKDSPLSTGRPGFFIQEDNVMVEFNIPPSTTIQQFKDSINYMLEFIDTACIVLDCRINKSASGEFNERYLNTLQALTFGCDPDYNAYTGKKNPGIKTRIPNLRTCGGHVHVGYDDPDEETSRQLIQALDITLGLPSLIKDPDKKRREMYGKAGSYRLQEYGVEYRTLSNFWIFSDEHLNWVYDGVHNAIELVNSGFMTSFKNGEDVQKTINSNNEDKALKLIQEIINSIKKEKVCVD